MNYTRKTDDIKKGSFNRTNYNKNPQSSKIPNSTSNRPYQSQQTRPSRYQDTNRPENKKRLDFNTSTNISSRPPSNRTQSVKNHRPDRKSSHANENDSSHRKVSTSNNMQTISQTRNNKPAEDPSHFNISNNSSSRRFNSVSNFNNEATNLQKYKRDDKNACVSHTNHDKEAENKNFDFRIYHTQTKPILRSRPSTIDLNTEEGRKKVADETMKILTKNNGKYTYTDKSGISEEVTLNLFNCKNQTLTYTPNYYNNFNDFPSKGSMCKIEVVPESTFGAARRLVKTKLKTCVLNFASATKPGGGFLNGKKAQEESLSRQSALYICLKRDKEMYKYHLDHKYDNVYKDYMIFSEEVPVFRDDTTEQLLPKSEVFTTCVITSAAPWKTKIEEAGGDVSNLNKIIFTRCEKILKCAIDNKIQILVLGAYGCGVFGNKPKDISKIFKELLIDKEYGKYFKVVTFAITGPHSENFTEFRSTFSQYLS